MSRKGSSYSRAVLILGAALIARRFSPSLLARLNNFIHIAGWTYFPQRPILQGWMLRHELNGMIHIPRLKHANAA